jgi:hypothetical protein
MWPEVSGDLEKFIEIRTRDLPACSIVPQLATLLLVSFEK